MRRVLPLSCALALSCVVAWSTASADKGGKVVDTIWRAPDFASFDVKSVALLPAATYDGSIEARKLTETAIGQALRGAGYRWTSTLVTRDELRSLGGDSLLKAFNEQLLKSGRLDSLQAPLYSRTVHSRALLVVRVDRFERLQLEFNQSGKPTTTVELTAALVDSTGRLLWTAHGTETAEGPYQDPATLAGGVRESGLNNTPMTNQGGAPGFAETLNRICTRWATQFPARVVAPAGEAH